MQELVMGQDGYKERDKMILRMTMDAIRRPF